MHDFLSYDLNHDSACHNH